MANNCKTTGVGPNCSPPEVGDGEKYECLEKEIRRCLGVLNRCIGDARIHPGTSYSIGSVWSGWTIEGASGVSSRMARISGCYDTLNCNFRKCYCLDWSCGGFCIDPVGFNPPKKKNDDGTSDETGADPDAGPTLSGLSVTSSSYDRVLERVYGAHVVTGNVFWTSEQIEATRSNVRLNRATGLYENAATTRYYINFALGLCAGEIQDVLRVWADDVLIYSRDFTSGESLQSGATLNGTELGIDLAQPYNPIYGKLHVFTGSEDQSPSPLIDDGLAYRGLAYLLFENFDITDGGGRLPTFRVEVVRNVEDVAAIIEFEHAHDTATTLGSIPPDILVAYPTFNIVQVGGAGSGATTGRPGLRVATYDTLETVRSVAPGVTLTTSSVHDYKTFVPLNDKYFVVQNGAVTAQRPANFIRNASPAEMSSFGLSTGIDNHALAAIADMSLSPYASMFDVIRTGSSTSSYVLFAASGPDLGLYALDIASGAFTPFVLFNDMVSGSISKVVRHRQYAGLDTSVPTVADYVSAFAMSGSRTSIEVRRLTLSHSEGLPYFDVAQTPVAYSIPASVWGGVTSGASLRDVIYLSFLDAFLITMSTASGNYILLWKPTGVVWFSAVPAVPVAQSVGPRMYDHPSANYAWIGSDNTVYSIDLASGQVTEPAAPAVTCVGAQYYNPLESSVTFISGAYTTSKLFLTHRRAAPQSLAAIVSDILVDSGLTEDEIDVSGLLDVSLDGYKVNNNSTAASVLQQLAVLYGLVIYEQSGQLVAALRARTAPLFIDEDDYSGLVDVKFVDTYQQLLSVSLTYNSRANEYKDQTQSMRKTQFLRGTEFVEHIVNRSHSWPVVMSDTPARAVCERILFEDEIVPRTAEIVIGPQYARLSPGDLVTIDVDGTDITMETRSITEDFEGFSRKVSLREIRPELFIEAASVLGVTDFSGRYVSDPIPAPRATTPILFPVPPPAYQDVGTVAGRNAIMMVGTDDGPSVFVARDIYYLDGNGNTQLGGTQTNRTLIGSLLTPPDATVSYFSKDKTSAMVIRFSNTEIADHLTDYASSADLLGLGFETNMLIVGQEWIQYQNFEIDSDGLTVTFRNLHRGLRNTDDVIDAHSVGETCAIYVAGSVVPVRVPLRDEDDATLAMGIVVSGTTPDPSTFSNMPLIAYNLKAPAPPTTAARRRARSISSHTTAA